MFEVIPVMDLMGGLVVHARRGDRARYRPVVSRLCASAQPLAMVQALLNLHPFRTLYIADLDAIGGVGHHYEVLDEIGQKHPDLSLWVDAGFSSAAALARFAGRALPVVGAESVASEAEFEAIASMGSQAWILSMDFRGEHFLGPRGLLERTALWPERVLAMNLLRVGSGQGPDVELFQRLRAMAPLAAIYAAGGVRHAEDLASIRAAGAHGALVATALHEGALDATHLAPMHPHR